MLARLAAEFPEFDPVTRMIEQAEAVRDQITAEQVAHEAAVKAGKPADEIPPLPAKQDRDLLSGMYERPAKYLLPRLKETQLEVTPGEGTSFTVVIERPGK